MNSAEHATLAFSYPPLFNQLASKMMHRLFRLMFLTSEQAPIKMNVPLQPHGCWRKQTRRPPSRVNITPARVTRLLHPVITPLSRMTLKKLVAALFCFLLRGLMNLFLAFWQWQQASRQTTESAKPAPAATPSREYVGQPEPNWG